MRRVGDPSENDLVPKLRLSTVRGLQACLRMGPSWKGATVIRLFPTRGSRPLTLTFAQIAEMVGVAMNAHAGGSTRCGLIMLPAGATRLTVHRLPGARWTDTDRVAVRAALVAWGSSLGRLLPNAHPPVCVGVDAAVQFVDGLLALNAVQATVLIVGREPVAVTLKSKPANAEERSYLPIAWDREHARPTDTALVEQAPITELQGERTLVLVCHDAVAFAQRSVRAARPGSWSDTIRRQYERLIETHRPTQVLNLIHALPGRTDAKRMLVPIFQSAHRVLRERYGMRVFSVAAPRSECALPAFQAMHARLACDAPHLDVLIGRSPPTTRRRARSYAFEAWCPELDDLG